MSTAVAGNTLFHDETRAKVPCHRMSELKTRILVVDDDQRLPLFPAFARKLGRAIFGLWPTDTEIADEGPMCRDIENARDGDRIEYRDPANAKAGGAGRKP